MGFSRVNRGTPLPTSLIKKTLKRQPFGVIEEVVGRETAVPRGHSHGVLTGCSWMGGFKYTIESAISRKIRLRLYLDKSPSKEL